MLGTKICIIIEALLNMQSYIIYIYFLNKHEWTLRNTLRKLTTQCNRTKKSQDNSQTSDNGRNKKRLQIPRSLLRNFCMHKLEQGVVIKRNLIKSSGSLKIYKKLRKHIFALEERKCEWKKKINRHSKLTPGAIIPLLRVLRREAIENRRAQ